MNFQTILINNRTQIAVEQHFGDMKHNYFNNGRQDRLDDFVYDYHSSIVRQEKQFAEFYVSTKKKQRKNPKSTNSKHELSPKKRRTSKLTESKFRKRKRNARSFYSSPLCTRKLKFKSGPEFSGKLEKCGSTLPTTPSMCRFIFYPGKQHRHCMSLLASFIWHQMPFNKSNILEKALILRNSLCLFFLGLCSLCINPRSKTHSAIIEHVHDNATIGWLTDDVVDSYIARTTELWNSLQSSLKFGCIECMALVQVLQWKNLKILPKALQTC